MEDTNTVIKWILASVSMIAGILILQPYGLLFFGVACMIISFMIVNSIDDSKPIDWNKVWRDSDNKFNKQKFDHINKRLHEVEKVSLSNI